MVHLCASTGFDILPGFKIHTPVLALPTPTHDIHGHEMPDAVVGYVLTDIILITAVVAHDLIDVAGVELPP